jgi:hypothetical protein
MVILPERSAALRAGLRQCGRNLFLCLPGAYSSSRLRRNSETYRAIFSRPAKAGLEHRGLETRGLNIRFESPSK